MSLRILNQVKANTLQYLPYGATTLEIKIEGDAEKVFGHHTWHLHPSNLADRNKNLFVGFSDQTEDFLVLWGAGSSDGLTVNNNTVKGRLFFQILHKGNSIDSQRITLSHHETRMPITTIKLVPAEDRSDLVKMDLNPHEGGSEFQIISFKGNRTPIYYSRWFPPRPSENKKIQYHDIEVPNIKIKFKVKENSFIPQVNSDIEILLNDNPNPIANVTGDWQYSSPHAEIFTIFGDSDYLVLRLWLYWINGNFSKNILRVEEFPITKNDADRDNQINDQRAFESADIECPDYERFDFLINMKIKKIIWVGTDFHYQESWYKIGDAEPFVRAKIAKGVDTVELLFKKIKDRFDPPNESFDPMTQLKKLLVNPEMQYHLVDNVPGPLPCRGKGFTRKHVPYTENGKAVAELVSSIVSYQ